MGRLVHYSVSVRAGESRPDLVAQLNASAGTLRAHNPDIPVVLFLHGAATPDLIDVCRAHHVAIHQQGPYEHRLAALCPAGWPALARYPLLHRFLNFGALAAAGVSQTLYLDCDTVFFDDVTVLMDRYAGAHVAGREEVHTSRSRHGVDRSFVDEPLLAELAASQGAAAIPPFNLGVVLFTGGVIGALAQLERLFVDYAWRFALWTAQHPVAGAAAGFGEFLGAEEARAIATPDQLARALPYPSVNRWILDEVALWLTLGHIPGLRTTDFDHRDVAENGEFAAGDPADWVVCHYYSQNVTRIDEWLRVRSGGSHAEQAQQAEAARR
jgi:hypothetical protein